MAQAAEHPPGEIVWGGGREQNLSFRKAGEGLEDWGKAKREEATGRGERCPESPANSYTPYEEGRGWEEEGTGEGQADSCACRLGRVGTATGSQGDCREASGGKTGAKRMGWGSKKRPRGRSWPQKVLGHQSYRALAPLRPPPPPPPSAESPRRWSLAGKWLCKVARSQCTVLRGVPGWSLHVSLCISKAQSHPVCANHHN